MSIFENRLKALIGKLSERNINVALITDDDSVYYYTGYYDYLHMEFGRPSILAVTRDGNSLLITPSMEMDMAEAAAHVDRIAAWNDGMGNEWREELPALLSGTGTVALEPDLMPPLVRNYVNSLVDTSRQIDIVPVISDMRMIKSEEELNLARHAGQVAMAMMAGGRGAIAAGV
ncbi:aminopeptidase P family N-terminal domain-containing protein, partial [Alphaproteobacteria bacterium]|nr:aminopeptidase P family N-terminal domain-containing protein [Alphaproteobacteria bacterium]